METSMNSVDKTKALKRVDLPIELLFVNELNPNVMSDMEFNLLSDNIERMGITDPILVRPIGDKYRIVGGAHRYEVAKLQGFETVPCTVVEHPDFDDDSEKFQIVRHNIIRGKMSPDKFMKLYESLGEKYSEEILKDSFGFADEEEFRKYVKQVESTLPDDLKQVFKDASAEIKTIDDLSRVLNGLFTKYGDSLPYGYMLIDFGSKQSVWLRMSEKTRKALYEVGALCKTRSRTIDDIIGGLVQSIAAGHLTTEVEKLIQESKEVKIPEGIELPTEETLGL